MKKKLDVDSMSTEELMKIDDINPTLSEMICIRKKQFEVAMDGDVRMLIWLGKQYLEQSDNPIMVVESDLPQGFNVELIE